LKILIIGGYGTFGGRLAELLSNIETLTLLIAGRSELKAIKFISKLAVGAKKIPLSFDRDGDLEKQISVVKPDLVIDATGPFQFYGDDPYRVVKACISQHANYMDLADGAEFVSGIEQFDKEAKASGIYILSGVSSFPVLTAAVVRHLSHDMAQVTDIKGGIAPSPYAGVGLNVIRAIASYAGKQVTIIRDGKNNTAYALTESFDYCIAPPGYLPLRKTRFSLMDVPDIYVLPKIWPQLRSMWMGAGPVPAIFHCLARASTSSAFIVTVCSTFSFRVQYLALG
jgi:saccharopine dehydrogenase-like NADP-dependent oxidoreductase